MLSDPTKGKQWVLEIYITHLKTKIISEFVMDLEKFRSDEDGYMDYTTICWLDRLIKKWEEKLK